MKDDDDLLARLRDALDDGPSEPSPERLAAFRAQVDAQRRIHDDGAAAAGGPTAPRRPTPWLAVAASLLVVGGILGAAVWAIGTTSDRTDDVAGVVEYDGALVDPAGVTRGAMTVTEIGIGRVVELRTDELPILPVGEYYAVWFVGPGDSPTAPNRISAGTFHPDDSGRSDVQFAAAVNPALYPVIEITAEPGDGDPAPSGDVVLRAEIQPTAP